MLILTRKQGERILIGADIWLEVVEVRGDRVKLGLVAPLATQIRREEVPPLPPEEDTRGT